MAIPAASKVKRYAIAIPKKLKPNDYKSGFRLEWADPRHNANEEDVPLIGRKSALSPNLKYSIELLGPSIPQTLISCADNLNRNLSMNCSAPQDCLSFLRAEPRFFTHTKHYLAIPILYRRFGFGAETVLPNAERY